jgi:hypothetical protein
MPTLSNNQLRIEVLDPLADRARLGQRYGWGGYIWQVHDANHGPLLAGPEWPEANPSVDNGQGLPEACRHRTTRGEPLLWKDNIGLLPGGGKLGRDSAGATIVTEPCRWETERHADRLIFRTEQVVADWSYQLVRKLELHGREVLSVTQLTNRAQSPLVLEWFAHPFFALDSDGRAGLTLPAGTRLPQNEGYVLEGRQLGFRRGFVGKDDGCLVQLELPRDSALDVRISHPRLSHVDFKTSFAPSKVVLWANGNTVSVEPFQALHLAAGETRQWTLTYEFGR